MVKVSKTTKTKSIRAKTEPEKPIISRLSVVSPKISTVETEVFVAKTNAKKNIWQAVAWGRVGVGLVTFFILIGTVVWLFSGRGLVVDNVKGDQLSDKQQALILEKISKHIKLPAMDYRIAIVSDPVKLKTLSPFYEQVKAGDVVVVYEHFALIFDERADILVNATMLNKQ